MSFFDDWGWLGDVAGDVGEAIGIWDPLPDDAFGTGGSWDVGGLLGLGSKIYSGLSAQEQAERQLAAQQPLQEFYAGLIPQVQQFYDPATARKGIRQEYEERLGMLTPYWEETDLARRARAARAGMLGSTTFGEQQADVEAERAKVLAQQVLPAAEAAYYSRPTQLVSQAGQVAGLMTGQPIMQPSYQSTQQAALDPWSFIIQDYIKNI